MIFVKADKHFHHLITSANEVAEAKPTVILGVCRSVCLLVIRISQKVIDRFEPNFVE